jgi:regulator of protease activity HflC (stomatin/prohibitin superfamily)
MTSLVFAGVIAVFAFFVSVLVKKYYDYFGMDFNLSKLISKATMGFAVFLPILVVGCHSYTVVPVGHVGIVKLFGQIQEKPLYSGFSFINPLVEVEMVSTQISKHGDGKHELYDAASKDMQTVHVIMVINYHLIADHAPTVLQEIGQDYLNKVVVPAAQEVLKANMALHNASEILHLRPRIKDDIQGQLKKWLLKYGIELKEVALANVSFDPGYTRAIEQKQIQEQLAEQKKYELIRTQREAEIATAKAKGEADALRESAKAKADALRMEGEAQATYNSRVAASVTDALISMEYLKRWDGKLPVYMMGDSKVTPLINLPAGMPVKKE